MDRIRRSEAEDVVGMYVYDFDMDINWNEGPNRLREVNPNPSHHHHHHPRENHNNNKQQQFNKKREEREGVARPGGGMLMRQQSQGVLSNGKRGSYENLMDPALIGGSGKKVSGYPTRKGSYMGTNPNRDGVLKPSIRLKQNNNTNQGSKDVSLRSDAGHMDSVPFSGSSSSYQPQAGSNLLSTNGGRSSGPGSASGMSAAALEQPSASSSVRLFSESNKSNKSENTLLALVSQPINNHTGKHEDNKKPVTTNPLPPLIFEKSLKDSTGRSTTIGTLNNTITSTSTTHHHNNLSPHPFGTDNVSPLEVSGNLTLGVSQKNESSLDLETLCIDNPTTTASTHGGNAHALTHNTTPHNNLMTDNIDKTFGSSSHSKSRNHAVTNGTTGGLSHNNSHTNSHNNSHSNSHNNSHSNSRNNSHNNSLVYESVESLVALEESLQHGKKGTITTAANTPLINAC